MESRWKAALVRMPVLYHLALAARESLRGLHRAGLVVARGPAIRRYLAAHPVRKLQVGCGEIANSGWLNADFAPRAPGVVFMDATRRFPFDDATFDYVFSEHLIEHIAYEDGLAFLAESRRVLRPGGRIRIATPDLARLAAMIAPGATGTTGAAEDPTARAYREWIAATCLFDPAKSAPAFVLNHNMRAWGHTFLYDEPTLRAALGQRGFTDIRRVEMGKSADPELVGLEMHGRIVGNETLVAWETMVIEAVCPKPA
ncbi:MAG: class I SAM-dependent methyltransferase [Candidatus Eiseniibacteriota bacterium]